ncbi:hypothetical protein BGZ98_006979 [Dissophora globulifera]|nr:hypothetical protein BGZ98_006979 [Dissophora globulifera]
MLNACDSKGDHIHQPLMAKKMQRLEASTDFRPFKFRIQAFTNAFHDDLVRNGLTEDILPLRKVKVYLWKHRYISRFNEDGKKQKSKGNHVWNIEARKISNLRPSSTACSSDKNISYDDTYRCYDFGNGSNSSGNNALADLKSIGPEAIAAAGGGIGVVRRQTSPVRWEFREYSSRIAGQVIKFARVGVPYVYSPRIWDAQMSCPAAKFSSPWLPPWLKWHKGELKGIPGPDDESCTITVIAEYVREGEECRLEMSFPLMVSDPSKEGELIDSPNENYDEDDLEEELDNRPRGRERGRGRQRDMDRHMEVDTPRLHERHHCHEYRQQPLHHYQHHHRGASQSSQSSQCQALQQNQAQLQHLQLQEDSQWQYPQREESRSDEEQRARDEPQEIADDYEAVPVDIGAGSGVGDEEEVEEGKLHVRKQSRERLSFILVQDPKRRRHD